MKRRCTSSSRSCWPRSPAALFGGRAQAQETADDVEVMLAFDASGSMRHAIEAAKAAANEFVLAMPADVRIGLETFGDDVTVLVTADDRPSRC